ncbi:MAG TPA: biotin carboxylase N-terminal domain-containing protein [Polyangiales bacterium]|nr:biotin carboxylase N-terminal domain-containing protein [Polyangiales bacterium]
MEITPIRRLAIVNRGEAAMRCVRTVKSLRALEGSELSVIALYTDVDREAPFVRHADMAIRLPVKTTPVAAYLDHDLLLSTLRQINADAVWPGWGFVAESAEFVDKLRDAGIRFLGPTGDTMRRLGDKIASKELAERVGVPVTAWSSGALRDVDHAREAAARVGYPLVVKASAGGGGRGIRVVEHPDALEQAFNSARSEAKTAFGDDRLFLEKMVKDGRHIEVQIVADRHGYVKALGCRDCSVQRRHQKVVEEAPPAELEPALLARVKASAEQLAAHVGYSGVGTVEFLVKQQEFFFLEMNPRLQVEHGITEELTRTDLVELQIRIARGESLEDLAPREHGVCIEARVCAEDPDQGFLPAPGRIALFDPALGPRVRIDSGVVQNSTVPSAFDSMVAKVMAFGDTREEARARLITALRDFDLVIERGASNKSYLIQVLESEAYKAGGVDTRWLDRWNEERDHQPPHAAEALVLAGILSYRAQWRAERRVFFSDTSSVTPDKIPALGGREFDLEYFGESYRLRVFSVGASRYRVHMDGRVISARFGDPAEHTARMVIQGRYMRAVHDVTDASIRVEIEGYAHRFGRQTAGQVRAGAPSMVVSIEVKPGDQVKAGQLLGAVEAMKMEIGFNAPVAGTVTEVRVAKGQQVGAGDTLLVIEPAREDAASGAGRSARLRVPEEADPLDVLFDATHHNPDLIAADKASAEQRRLAMDAVNDEVRRILLGFDLSELRFERLLTFLEAPLPAQLSSTFLSELAQLRSELCVFTSVEQLFSRARQIGENGLLGPSNSARFRGFLRRMRTQGAGVAPDFLEMLKGALAQYGVDGLEHNDALEKAVFRMFATQRDPEPRRRLAMAIMRRFTALIDRGVDLSHDEQLRAALLRIADLRDMVGNALADNALEAHYRVFQRPALARHEAETVRRLDTWLRTAESQSAAATPNASLLGDLTSAPASLFVRVLDWLHERDRQRRAIAVSALLRRLYAPRQPSAHVSEPVNGHDVDRMQFNEGVVLGVSSQVSELTRALSGLLELARAGKAHALELILAVPTEAEREARIEEVRKLVPSTLDARLTLTQVLPDGQLFHTTWRPSANGVEELPLHGLHPEAAERVDLGRYTNFELERLWGSDDVYCFQAVATQDKADQRMFVLADVRGRPAQDSSSVDLFVPIFERAFQEATRTLRLNLGVRDPRRELQWNRLVMHLQHEVDLDAGTAQRLARELLSNTRHLGLEKTIVRLKLASRDSDRQVELAFSDLASSRLDMTWRKPRRVPLVPATPYERKVAACRRRDLVYPYEIVRMLTQGNEAVERALEASQHAQARPVLPVGRFEEYDLDPNSAEITALNVNGREPGKNESCVIFGVISTPTVKVPEGMQRVLILSDPTMAMGALATPDCDRLIAAIDLAERLSLPVEWVPISAGAKIAMDSGTENMDSIARVVRRIVTFTQAGGMINIIVTGVNVGAQSYWNSLATMLMHTRGCLIMTPQAYMVLTGSASLAASGSVSAEDEVAIGGHERVMGPNGEAQYFAPDLLSAYKILYDYYAFTYVAPGESGPRKLKSQDSSERDILTFPYYDSKGGTQSFKTVGEILDSKVNPGRKRMFAMRALMQGVIDSDGPHLERWEHLVGGETAIVWDAHLGGFPVCLLGIESQNLPRMGYRPSDGPEEYNGGTLFPQSSKKVARALNAASGVRPCVLLANISGFDGSPESMRKLQLEYGAEIARAVVNFQGPIVFCIVGRYHGGAYVVFSRGLNDNLRALAVEGSYASVIGGGPAAAVVFPREVRARVAKDPRIEASRARLRGNPSAEERAEFDRLRRDVTIEKRAEIAAEFDAVHSVERAKRVGSIEEIIPARDIRPHLIALLERDLSNLSNKPGR